MQRILLFLHLRTIYIIITKEKIFITKTDKNNLYYYAGRLKTDKNKPSVMIACHYEKPSTHTFQNKIVARFIISKFMLHQLKKTLQKPSSILKKSNQDVQESIYADIRSPPTLHKSYFPDLKQEIKLVCLTLKYIWSC